MKTIIIFLLFLAGKPGFSQSDSIDYYIKRLNWNSFEVFYSFAPKISITADGRKIVDFEDSQKVTKLINALSDKHKTVAAHLILSQLFDSAASEFSIGSRYNNKDISESVFTYNQLEWTKSLTGGYSITKKYIRLIRAYWIKRTGQRKSR